MSVAAVFAKKKPELEQARSAYTNQGVPEWLMGELTSVREKPPLKPDSWVTASGLGRLCPRYETLRAVHEITIQDTTTGVMQWTFDVGNAYHDMYREHYMGPRGAYLGRWRCLRCGWNTDQGVEKPLDWGEHGIPQPAKAPLKPTSYMPEGDFPSEEHILLAKMPERCPNCGGKRAFPDWTASGREVDGHQRAIVYHEWLLTNEEYRVRVMPDGWRQSLSTEKILFQELKSISPNGYKKIKSSGAAKPEHVVQTQAGLWLSGWDIGEIVYFCKAPIWRFPDGWKPEDFFHQVVVRYDEGTLEATVWGPVTEMREALKAGTVTKRICVNTEVPRAKDCDLCQLCFKEPNG